MAGDEPRNMITTSPKLYNPKDALKEAKRQQRLPYEQQSRWYNAKTGARVYFSGI